MEASLHSSDSQLRSHDSAAGIFIPCSLECFQLLNEVILSWLSDVRGKNVVDISLVSILESSLSNSLKLSVAIQFVDLSSYKCLTVTVQSAVLCSIQQSLTLSSLCHFHLRYCGKCGKCNGSECCFDAMVMWLQEWGGVLWQSLSLDVQVVEVKSLICLGSLWKTRCTLNIIFWTPGTIQPYE